MHSELGGPVPSLRPDIQCLLSTWEQAVAANQRTALFSDLSAQEIPRWFSMLASLVWSLEGPGT